MKIAFIIPYFGHFNNYFDLWLKSCACNSTIDWLIFTDCKDYHLYPDNVYVHYITFPELKELFQQNFPFKICLDKPYKLCDFKPAFGDIFQDYIKNYDYWGFCDTDLIWGNIRQFITNEILNQYPKIGIFGHCCLIQNKPEFNKMYTTIMDGIPNYKIVFTSSLAYCFDENRCFNKFFELKQIPVYRLSMCFDVSYVYGHFYPAKSHEPQDYHNLYNAVFNWQGGQLRCVYITAKGVVCVKDILYAHFQKRAMAIDIKNTNEFSIIPNRFVDYIPSWNLILINRFAPRKLFYLPYIKRRIKYLVGKILGTNNPKFYHYNY